MDGDRERNLLHIGRHLAQSDLYGFIIAFACAGTVVTGIDHAASGILWVVIENKIGFGFHFSTVARHEHGYIQIKFMAAVIFIGVPAKPGQDGIQTSVALGQIHFLSF